MKSTEQQHIINGIKSADTATLKAFYKKNWIPVCNYILTHGGTEQEAEDIFHDALECLYHKAVSDTLNIQTASLHSYFYAMCKNMWCNYLQRKKKFVAMEEKFMNQKQDTSCPDQRETYQEQYHLFQAYIQKLSASGKQLIQLVIDGYSIKEIAHTMGYSEGYTRKKKFETKKALLEKLYDDRMYWELAG